MNNFLKGDKKFLTFFLILIIGFPIIGVNFFLSFLGNIIIILFLIPILLLLILFIGFNSYKSKVNICNNCGSISLGLSDTCFNCGANLSDKKNQLEKKPSERTIEVKAEEIK